MARSQVEQRAELEVWRASGMTMTEFARTRGYSRSAIEKWARKAREERPTVVTPRFVRVEVARPVELVIEIGVARIRVARGLDASLLREVVDALGAPAS